MYSLRRGGAIIVGTIIVGMVLFALTVWGAAKRPAVREYALGLPYPTDGTILPGTLSPGERCRLTFSADGRRVAAGGSGPAREANESKNGIALILDTTNGKVVARHNFSGKRGTIETGSSDRMNRVTDMQFSPDGKRLAVSDELGAYLWDPKEGNVKEVVQTNMGVKSIAFSRDGKLLATGAFSGGITLWDTATLKPQRLLDKALQAAVAFSRDGKLLASAEGNNRVHLWDVASGEQLAEDHAMMGPLYDVALAPDDKSLAAVGEGGGKVWNVTVQDGKPALKLRHTLMGHLASVYFVDFSPDGKFLATSSGDKSLKVWDAATGRQLATVLSSFDIGEAVFSPDGKSLAAVGLSGMKPNTPVPMLRLWKLDDLLDPKMVKAQAKEAVAELFRLAETGKPEEGFLQLAAVGPAPETTVPLLVEGFKSENALVRRWAVAALRMVGVAAKPAVPEIRKLLTDENPEVRQDAASLLEQLESQQK